MRFLISAVVALLLSGAVLADNPFDKKTYRQSTNPFDRETYRQTTNPFDRETYIQRSNPFDAETFRQGPFLYPGEQ